MPQVTLATLRRRLARFRREPLILLPTPLARLDRLSRELGGPEIWIKRDDLTGAGFGGNKSRKLEFIIADALAKKARTLITWGSVQSNWCLQAASSARRVGLRPVLVLFKTPGPDPERDGNLLLDFILGADIRLRPAEKGKLAGLEEAERAVRAVASEVEALGEMPYIVAVGGSRPGFSMTLPLGALSYAVALAELEGQASAAGLEYTHIVHATGSGGTQAGLALGARFLRRRVEVIGISVSDPAPAFTEIVLGIIRDASLALELGMRWEKDDLVVVDEAIGEGYGVIDAPVAEAIRLAFISEGIVLDPVYTGKAMAGLIGLVKRGRLRKSDKVVFIHTGGAPALFSHKAALVNLLGREGRRGPTHAPDGETP